MKKIIMKGYQCFRCEHQWVPREDKIPNICPKCKSENWKEKRTKFQKQKYDKFSKLLKMGFWRINMEKKEEVEYFEQGFSKKTLDRIRKKAKDDKRSVTTTINILVEWALDEI